MLRKDFENYSGSYYLKKDWVFPYSEIPRDSEIVLHGAGDVGQAYYEQVCFTGYCKIKHWIDKNFFEYKKMGLPVDDPEIISSARYDYVVIAVANAAIAREINKEEIVHGVPQEKIVWIGNGRASLRAPYEKRILEPVQNRTIEILKHRNIEVRSEEAVRLIKKINQMSKEGIVLPRIVVEISPFCTLHCTKCNNLMPLYRNSSCRPLHCPKEDIFSDIDILMSNVDMLLTLELIGGEPFAHPDFLEILKYVLSKKNIMEVEITTNGTIVPSEDILKEMCNAKVIVKISEYQCVKKEVLIDRLLENAIRYEIYKDLSWTDSGSVEKRGRSQFDLKRIYSLCSASYSCKTLYKGKLYACARTANLYGLGLCADAEGYVDLRGTTDLKQEIWNFFLKQDDPGCDYCDYVETWRQIPMGEQ